jgi:predicted O-methyltransferase YrrM
MRTPPALHAELAALLDGVDGWLHPAEAAVLYRAAAAAAARRSDPTIAEIGSWKGRSTIALAKGLLDAGVAGTVYAIDPHIVRPEIPDQAEDRLPALQANLRRTGVADAVEIVHTFSHDARPRFADGSIDVLFIDGDHSYAGVTQDIDDWVSALAPRAVVGFNDYQIPDVAQALRERIVRPGSAFRNPRWAVSSLFLDYDPTAPWRAADRVEMWRARAFLRVGVAWLSRVNRLAEAAGTRPSRRLAVARWTQATVLHPLLRAVLPIAE